MTKYIKEIVEWVKAIQDTVVEIGKRMKYLPAIEDDRIQQHLQVDTKTEITSVSSVISHYQRITQMAVLEDYLKEGNITILKRSQFSMHEGSERGAFEYSDIEIEPDKFIKAVEYGHLFLVHEPTSLRFVLKISESGLDTYKIRVFIQSDENDYALKIITGLSDYAKAHNILKGKKITPYLRHIKLNVVYTWDSVILNDATKGELRKNIDLLLGNIEIYKKSGLTFKRGLILKGSPGTGKTLIGKVLCNVTGGTTFLWVTPGDLNETRKVRGVCELARELAPSILFLEDVDLYGGHREQQGDRGILGELMNQLDGLIENEFVIVIATTNCPDEIEVALRNRPGRFDRVIDVPLPDEKCRAQMFRTFLSNINVQVTNFDRLIEKLAKSTEEYTGAHAKELINSAIISAVDEKSLDKDGKVILKIQHFKDNIDVVKLKKISAAGFAPAPQKVVDYNFDLDD